MSETRRQPRRGTSRSEIRRKNLPRADLIEAIGDGYNQTPTAVERKLVAHGLKINPSEVPEFDTVAELQIWVFRMLGLMGSHEHFRELGDRWSPKPSRTQNSDGSRSTRGPTSPSKSSAEKWFEALDGPTEATDDNDELDDIL